MAIQLTADTAGSSTVTSRTAFYACLVFVAVAVGRITELLPFLGYFQLGNVSALALIVALVATSGHRLSAISDTRLTTPVLIFFALVVLSFSYSIWRGASYHFITGALPILVLIYIGVAKTLGDIKDLRTFVYVVMFSAVLFTIEGLTSDWGERVEVESHFFDQNELALFLCCILPFMLAEASLASRKWLKLALVGACFGAILVMILTQSRGGFLALSAVILTMILFRGFRLDTKPADFKIRVRRAFVLCVAAILVLAIAPDSAKDRLMTVTDISNDYNMVSKNEGRIAVWSRGLSYLKSHPWGGGVSSYPKIDLLGGGQFRPPHNAFVQVAVEIGVIGFIVYIICFRRAISALRGVSTGLEARSREFKASRDALYLYAYSQALMLSLIAFSIAGFFLSYGYSVILFLLFGLIAHAERLGQRVLQQQSPVSEN